MSVTITMPIDTAEDRCLSPEELLTRYVKNALRQSGCPPLQYLDVETRDGHVYLSARVPTLLLTRESPLMNRTTTHGEA